MAGRMILCLRKQKRLFVKTFVGGTGVVIFWASVTSLLMIGFFRQQCSTSSYVLPLLMVPTSVMGIFTGIFLWMFVGFLWDKDIRDFMQFMAALSVIVTFILEFISFGIAIWKRDDPDCTNPFYGYSIGMPFSLGILLIFLYIVFGIDRYKNSRTNPLD
ncbi:uncharacterized protein LOC133174319 [Saccostrea echinata]|uniref:uncharacterized protein LOC133174319 n=1 Tax=Saccostrea echinata TaxID=191078 RepID=UPI002A82CB4D|nr:uncharacterized protein LOC133174319 [Saccostrea echinata]